MRRHALRQAAALTKATTAASEAGACGLAGALSQSAAAPALSQMGARQLGATPWAPAAAAAAAQPWLRGLHAWAAPSQQLAAAMRLGSHTPPACQQQQQQQQQRGFSAQAEAAAAAPSSSAADGGLSLSDAAVERLKELQAQSPGPVLLRVTVEGGGCSGFQYEFSMEEAGAELAETDRLFEREGVRLVCDDISLEFLKGATVDFESDLMRSAFVVASNPNAASSCGCGSSFVAK